MKPPPEVVPSSVSTMPANGERADFLEIPELAQACYLVLVCCIVRTILLAWLQASSSGADSFDSRPHHMTRADAKIEHILGLWFSIGGSDN